MVPQISTIVHLDSAQALPVSSFLEGDSKALALRPISHVVVQAFLQGSNREPHSLHKIAAVSGHLWLQELSSGKSSLSSPQEASPDPQVECSFLPAPQASAYPPDTTMEMWFIGLSPIWTKAL
jgi:hypothetical protein